MLFLEIVSVSYVMRTVSFWLSCSFSLSFIFGFYREESHMSASKADRVVARPARSL